MIGAAAFGSDPVEVHFRVGRIATVVNVIAPAGNFCRSLKLQFCFWQFSDIALSEFRFIREDRWLPQFITRAGLILKCTLFLNAIILPTLADLEMHYCILSVACKFCYVRSQRRCLLNRHFTCCGTWTSGPIYYRTAAICLY